MMERAERLGILDRPPKPILTGKHLIEWGLPTGEALGIIQKAAYAAQMDGKISDLDGATRWYKAHRAKILEESGLAPRRHLSGDDLKKAGLKQDATFGKIHRELYEAQLDNLIHSPSEAIAWLKEKPDLFPMPDEVLQRLIELHPPEAKDQVAGIA